MIKKHKYCAFSTKFYKNTIHITHYMSPPRAKIL